MQDTPKGLRTHIAIAGRRNAGKSSLINALSGQNVSIVSNQPGTTTDPVEKTMEIAGIGPVVLLDTAGIDDSGEVGNKRISRSMDVLRGADLVIIVTEKEEWDDPELVLAAELQRLKIPFIVARNKMDLFQQDKMPSLREWRKTVSLPKHLPVVDISAKNLSGIKDLIKVLKEISFVDSEKNPLLSDLLPPHGLAVLVVPIDSGAPKGRLILPQAQAIRDCLDAQKTCMVLNIDQYEAGLKKLSVKPDMVVCDSQVIKEAALKTPDEIPLTTFSILMARFKGNLAWLAAGAAALKQLKPGDTVLIQEACSHHPQPDDIGRIKIPALLRKLAGGEIKINFAAGKEILNYYSGIKAVIHCGGCVLTRRRMIARQECARAAGLPMTNYGIAISLAQGVLSRTLALFPDALAAFTDIDVHVEI